MMGMFDAIAKKDRRDWWTLLRIVCPFCRGSPRVKKIVLLFAAALAIWWIAGMALLYMQTGSPFVRSYHWYDAERVAERLLGESKHVYNHSDRCGWTVPPPSASVVYPKLFSHFLDDANTALEPKNRAKVQRIYVVTPHNDLLPWFWDSILQSVSVSGGAEEEKTSPQPHHTMVARSRMLAATGEVMHHRAQDVVYFPRYRMQFVFLPNARDLFRLADVHNVLLVGEHFEFPFLSELRAHTLKTRTKSYNVGAIMLTGEHCCNFCSSRRNSRTDDSEYFSAQSVLKEHGVKFAFLTYGDCQVVDNEHFFVWPLGPSVLHGFPSRIATDDADNPKSRDRMYLLNLMVSISPEKAARMQAWLAAQQVCAAGRGEEVCYMHWNNLLFKIAESVDRVFDTDLRSLSNAPAEYLNVLRQSKFTLCPSGKNPEQYRIWEAIMTGSIPIIEDPDFSTTLHPGYGRAWACTNNDYHLLLKQTGAPVMFLRDWATELPHLLSSIDAHGLATRQRAMQEWYRRFLVHLRMQVLLQVRSTMDADFDSVD